MHFGVSCLSSEELVCSFASGALSPVRHSDRSYSGRPVLRGLCLRRTLSPVRHSERYSRWQTACAARGLSVCACVARAGASATSCKDTVTDCRQSPIVVSPSEESDIIGMQSRVVDACCCGKVGHIFPFALRPALPVTICARCVQMSEISLQGGMCSMRQRAPPKRKRKIAGGAGGGYIEGGPSPPDGPRSSIRKRIYLTYRLSLKSLP